MDPTYRPSKRDAFLELLRLGCASLHFDSRRSGVELPEHLRGQAHLVLQYGYDLPIAIPDLEVDELGVRATLSFSRAPHHTVVPWVAVYAIAAEDGSCVLYDEDVPAEVARVRQGLGEIASAPSSRPRQATTASRAPATRTREMAPAREPAAGGPEVLRSLPADCGATPPPELAPRRRRPVLRLVK